MAIDWSKYRQAWSPVDRMTKKTRTCGDDWVRELEVFRKSRAAQGKFPREFPYPSDERLLLKLDSLVAAARTDCPPETLSEYLALDETKRGEFLGSVPRDQKKAVAEATAEVYWANLAELREALQDAKILTQKGINGAVVKASGRAQTQVYEVLATVGNRCDYALMATLPTLNEEERQGVLDELAGLIDAQRKVEECEVHRAIVHDIQGKVQGNPDGSVIVFVGGGGAAGKSTFTKRLEKLLWDQGQIECRRLELDSYFLPIETIGGRASDGKYDNPLNSDLDRAVENVRALSEGHWEGLTLPVHDRKDHKKERQYSEDANPFRVAKVVIVEGLYALGPCFAELGEMRIFIDASPTDRAKGRIWRDINVRRRSEQHVVEMLLGREAYHQTFVEPTQMVADYTIRRGPTVGDLGVTDLAESRRCLRDACLAAELTEQQAEEILEGFEERFEEAKKRHAGKTEF